MPCSGCARRRKKIAAAVKAVKTGFAVAKKSYKLQTGERSREIPVGAKVVDIRE